MAVQERLGLVFEMFLKFRRFLNNTQLRYTLESVSDYLKLPPTAPDTGCPSIQSASGVSNKDIEQKFHFTSA